MPSRISFSTWNINGLSNKTLGDKLQNNNFLSNRCDFVILTEICNRSRSQDSKISLPIQTKKLPRVDNLLE